MSPWRDRHARLQAAFGPNWRSTVLGLAAIVVALPLLVVGGVLALWEHLRTIGLAVAGHGLTLLGLGILAVWTQESKVGTTGHDDNVSRIRELELALAQQRRGARMDPGTRPEPPTSE
jgi:hypothetical protein